MTVLIATTVPSVSQRIRAIAERQHGYITIAQLLALGLSRAAVTKRTADGKLIRVHKGVYAVGHVPPSRSSAWMSAVLAGGAGAALGTWSQAEHLRIIKPPKTVRSPTIVIPRRHRPIAGIRSQFARALFGDEVLAHEGIQGLSYERTLVDLSYAVRKPAALTRMISEAWHQHPIMFGGQELDIDLVRRTAFRHRTRNGHGFRMMRDALRDFAGGGTGFRSLAEDLMVELLDGLGDPRICTPVAGILVDARLVEADLMWSDRWLIVEVDGPTHLLPWRKADDERRDAALRAAGWTVLRFTADQVYAGDPTIRPIVAAALGAPG